MVCEKSNVYLLLHLDWSLLLNVNLKMGKSDVHTINLQINFHNPFISLELCSVKSRLIWSEFLHLLMSCCGCKLSYEQSQSKVGNLIFENIKYLDLEELVEEWSGSVHFKSPRCLVCCVVPWLPQSPDSLMSSGFLLLLASPEVESEDGDKGVQHFLLPD